MSAPDLPRFKVTSVTGYAGGSGQRLVSTGYYVLDTWDNHREVASFDIPSGAPTRNMPTRGQRKQMAYARCAELEQWNAEALAS